MTGPNFKGPKGPNFKGPKGPNFKGPSGPSGPSGPNPPSGPRPPRAPNPPRGGSVNTPKPTQQGGVIRDAMRRAQDYIKRMPGSQPARPNPYSAKPTGQLTQKNVGSLLGLGSMTTTGAVTAPLILGGSEDASRKWSRLGYSSPEAYQKAVSQNANKERPIGSDTSSSTFNNTAEINARIKQQQAETAAALKKTKGDYDHSSGGYTDQLLPKVPTRDTPPPNGGDGSGTQTSPGGGVPTLTAEGVAGILQNRGIGRGAFSSVQLPGTAANPITGSVPDAFNITGLESITASTLGAYSNNGVNFAALDNTQINPENFTNPELGKAIPSTYQEYGGLASGAGAFAQQAPGAQKPTASPIKSGRLADALNDTAGMQSYMSKFGSTEQDTRRAADMAFLNADTAQEGLRAKEAVLGQFHTAGQTYQLGSDNKLIQGQDGKPLAMDSDAASSYRLGTSSAQQYKDSYKDKVKEIPAAKTPTTPAEAQNPPSINPVPVSKQTINTNLGPMINDEQYGQQLESFKGMRGVGPVINSNVYGGFLEGNREPMMRDTKKK